MAVYITFQPTHFCECIVNDKKFTMANQNFYLDSFLFPYSEAFLSIQDDCSKCSASAASERI